MRVFGGGTDERNQKFTCAFQAIGSSQTQGCLLACFTEIMNDGKVSAALKGIVKAFDEDLAQPLPIWIGMNGYAAIAFNWTHLKSPCAGQVLLVDNRDRGTWTALPPVMAPKPAEVIAATSRRTDLKGDSRGVAYVAGQFEGHICSVSCTTCTPSATVRQRIIALAMPQRRPRQTSALRLA